MWTKLLPEAGGCNLMFLPDAARGGQKFCRGLGQDCRGALSNLRIKHDSESLLLDHLHPPKHIKCMGKWPHVGKKASQYRARSIQRGLTGKAG